MCLFNMHACFEVHYTCMCVYVLHVYECEALYGFKLMN